jgi:hypothetical protein
MCINTGKLNHLLVVRPGRVKIFPSLHCPDWLWCPPSLLSNGYMGLFPSGMKLNTHLQLVPRSGTCASPNFTIHPLPHMFSWCSA